jgi:hypothetical protein
MVRPGTDSLATDATILASNLLQTAGLRSKLTAWDPDTRLTICWRAAWPWITHDLGRMASGDTQVPEDSVTPCLVKVA